MLTWCANRGLGHAKKGPAEAKPLAEPFRGITQLPRWPAGVKEMTGSRRAGFGPIAIGDIPRGAACHPKEKPRDGVPGL